jgi:YVTN family beta-propeller protein
MHHTTRPKHPRYWGFTRSLAIILASLPCIAPPVQAGYTGGALATGFDAGPIAVNPVNNKVYVGNYAMSPQYSEPEPGGPYRISAPFTIIDAATRAVKSLASGIWSDVKVNAVTNKVYVAGVVDGFGSDLMVIDGVTDAVTLVPVVQSPLAIAVNPVTNKIYVAGEMSQVSVVDGATNSSTTLSVGGIPCALAVNEATNRVYVANNGSTYVTVIDGSTNSITNVNIGVTSYAVAVNPLTNKIYFAGSHMTVIDGATNSVTALAVATYWWGSIAVNPRNSKIYATSLGSDNVTVIDGVTNAALNLNIGANPVNIAVNAVTDQVFVGDSYSNNVWILDGATNAVTAQIGVTGNPGNQQAGVSGIALNPVTNEVFVPTSYGVFAASGFDQAGIPSFSGEPAGQTVELGVPAVFTASAGSPTATTYLWLKDGVPLSDRAGIEGSSTPTLYLSAGVTLADTGSYSCVAANGYGSASSSEVPLVVVDSTNPGRIINLSTRAFVGDESETLIAGFVTRGAGSTTLILRAVGPSLAGLGVTGFMPEPVLSLFDGNSPANLITTDLGWQNAPSTPAGVWAGQAFPVDATAADFTQVGAFSLAANSYDSAVKIALPAGAYTSQVGIPSIYMGSGASSHSGVALAEIYSAGAGGQAEQLVNISSRAFVGTGSNVLIAGFVISGSTSQTVLIRASGPALQPFGVTGLLADPELQLFDGSQNLIAVNSSWGGNAQVASASANSGAFPWTNPLSGDSAILITLPPGNYTAEVSGQRGDTGVALVEVYAVPALAFTN